MSGFQSPSSRYHRHHLHGKKDTERDYYSHYHRKEQEETEEGETPIHCQNISSPPKDIVTSSSTSTSPTIPSPPPPPPSTIHSVTAASTHTHAHGEKDEKYTKDTHDGPTRAKHFATPRTPEPRMYCFVEDEQPEKLHQQQQQLLQQHDQHDQHEQHEQQGEQKGQHRSPHADKHLLTSNFRPTTTTTTTMTTPNAPPPPSLPPTPAPKPSSPFKPRTHHQPIVSNLSESLKPLTTSTPFDPLTSITNSTSNANAPVPASSAAAAVNTPTTNFGIFTNLVAETNDVDEREVVDRTDSWAKSVPFGKPPPLMAAAPPVEQTGGNHLEGITFGESPGDTRGLQNLLRAEKRRSASAAASPGDKGLHLAGGPTAGGAATTTTTTTANAAAAAAAASPHNANPAATAAAEHYNQRGIHTTGMPSTSPSIGGTGASIPRSHHSSSYCSPYSLPIATATTTTAAPPPPPVNPLSTINAGSSSSPSSRSPYLMNTGPAPISPAQVPGRDYTKRYSTTSNGASQHHTYPQNPYLQQQQQHHHHQNLQYHSSLPHMPPHPPAQAHLYASPSNVDMYDGTSFHPPLLTGPYTFCAFDTVPSAPKAKVGNKVLLVGRDGSIEVLALNADKPSIVGRIDGLNGRVVNAKILTWASSHSDPFALARPLVAVVLHGQLPAPAPTAAATVDGDALLHDTTPSDNVSGIFPPKGAGAGAGADSGSGSGSGSGSDLPLMQTSVQVYSLRTQKLVSSLYYTKPVPCYYHAIPGHPVSVPGPSGQLSLHVSGNYLLVASGISGEVYVFTAKFLETANPAAAAAANANANAAANAGGGGGGGGEGPTFLCLGKYWASTLTRTVDSRRQSYSSSSTSAAAAAAAAAADVDDGSDAERAYQVEVPLLSLSGRYLAVVSPSLTNKVSIQGAVPPQLIARGARGVNAYTPPARPSVTCVTDEAQSESLLNKMARGLTQELVRGAKWIGDAGLQTWNAYWNKDTDSHEVGVAGQGKAGSNGQYGRKSQQDAQGKAAAAAAAAGYFLPPTHAQDAPVQEPEVISFFDLKRLEEEVELRITAASASQIAVFSPPDGCSFLSLAPNGHYLLNSNTKGDVHHVWDLMQIRHCRTKAFLTDDTHPTPVVRQVARYVRMTTSSIVDAIWTVPNGEQVAIISQKGTIHIHDLPKTAFQWPPPRRMPSHPKKSSPGASSDDQLAEDAHSGNGVGSGGVGAGTSGNVGGNGGGSSSSSNPLSTAWKYVGERTQPLLAATSNFRKPSIGNLSGASALEVSAAAGLRGRKAVAAGFSRSVGAATGTMSTIRHARDNKLTLATFSHDALPGRITWFSAGSEVALGVVDGNAFRAYAVHRNRGSGGSGRGGGGDGGGGCGGGGSGSGKVSSSASSAGKKKGGKPRSVFGSRLVEMKLPSLIQALSHPEPIVLASSSSSSSSPSRETVGFWTLPSTTFPHQAQASESRSQPLSQAELDSNSPYLPFHTDRRVSLRVYPPSFGVRATESSSNPWSFGTAMPSMKLNVCSPLSDDDEEEEEDGSQDGESGSRMENHISADGAVGDQNHVVITTRRKKKNRGDSSQLTARGFTEDDGFFEDDCEVLDFAEDRV